MPEIPILLGAREGYKLEFVVQRPTRRAFLTGSTPCLPHDDPAAAADPRRVGG